jgi:curved DNA-binding protein CbpA
LEPIENQDPYEVLGIPENSSEAEIRAAYLRKVREFPPDRAPEQFQAIRQAYDTLKDPGERLLAVIRAANPFRPLPTLLDDFEMKRHFVGPGLWKNALKGGPTK